MIKIHNLRKALAENNMSLVTGFCNFKAFNMVGWDKNSQPVIEMEDSTTEEIDQIQLAILNGPNGGDIPQHQNLAEYVN